MSNVRTAPPQAEVEVHGALERDGDILRGKEALSQAVVDMAYSASAPTLMYAQQIDQYAYYKVIASSMEKSVAGCVGAARTAFAAVVNALSKPGSK